MKLSVLCALIALSSIVFETRADAAPASTAAAKKKPAAKVIHASSLKTAMKPSSMPGRSSIPVSNGEFYGSAQPTIKMKPKVSKLPAKAPARSVATTGKATGVVEPASAAIRVLRAGLTGPVPQLAAGQALAVGDSYLVTSADFVTDTWTNSGDVKFFVSDSTQSLALVGFDLGSNLAIFSTGFGSHMDHTLPLTRLRFDAAQANEDFNSLGLSGFVGGARRYRPVQDLTFVRDRFELPASVALTRNGPETQFLFDHTGRWFGSVSLLDHRDGRQFDVTSANQVYEMIKQIESRPPISLTASVLSQQAQSWQERWTNTFFDSAKRGLALRALDCEASAVHVSETKLASAISRTHLMHCSNAIPVSLTRDYAMGVEIVSGEVNFADDVKTFLALDSSAATVFAPTTNARGPASVNVMTGPECDKSDVANSRGHHFQVRFCTAALKTVSGLQDSTITVISSDTGVKSTVGSVRLRGFEPKNAKRFMEWMIETEALQ